MQAARGASLNSSDSAIPPAEQAGARRSRTRILVVFATIAALGYVADLLSKVWAVAHLSGGTPRPVIGDLLTLYLARNPGAAFSTGTSYTLVLSVLAIAAAGVVLWVARRLGSTGWAIGLGFLLAGILGNLTDRIFRSPGVLRGHVVDFLRLPHWPIFNVADVCINIAAGVIILQALRGMPVRGTQRGAERGADPHADDPDGAEGPGGPGGPGGSAST
jgi:signal peptidase II